MSSLAPSSRPLPSRIGGSDATSYLAQVDAHMLALLDAHSGRVAAAARAPIAAGGKRLRPLLVRAARPRAVGADPARASSFDTCSVHAGAAVELVHTASLVHDDLLDGAELRRGAPTIAAAAGHPTAAAAGDLLFSLAFTTLVECRDSTDAHQVLRATRVLARTARTLAEGEALQARQLRQPHLSETAYLERCAAKTGVLFAAALRMGSILGGSEATDTDLLGRFGTLVGTAFQLADDVLDCGAPDAEAVLGKRPGADLRDGTVTLPMLRAVASDPSLAQPLATPVAEAEVEQLLARIRAAGGPEAARSRAIELRDRALRLLPALEDRFDQEPLAFVAERSVERIA